jgi:hypothetical protein
MIKSANSNIVVTVENHHVSECGIPPNWHHTADSDTYVGYFCNQHGEQWLLIIDPEAQTGELRGGDLGWSKVVPITNGRVDPDVILGAEEHSWLNLCWRAACGESLE